MFATCSTRLPTESAHSSVPNMCSGSRSSIAGLHFGDVVLFRSDYSDKYYRLFPDGSRYIADILDQGSGLSGPDPDRMEFLATCSDDARHRQRQHGGHCRN